MARAPKVPQGPKKNFLVIVTPGGGKEYYDAGAYRPHLTGDGTLQIQKQGLAEMVSMYSPVGWTKYTWELEHPVTIDRMRADSRLPF